MTKKPQDVTVAFLETGQMGTPMASRLISAEIDESLEVTSCPVPHWDVEPHRVFEREVRRHWTRRAASTRSCHSPPV